MSFDTLLGLSILIVLALAYAWKRIERDERNEAVAQERLRANLQEFDAKMRRITALKWTSELPDALDYQSAVIEESIHERGLHRVDNYWIDFPNEEDTSPPTPEDSTKPPLPIEDLGLEPEPMPKAFEDWFKSQGGDDSDG